MHSVVKEPEFISVFTPLECILMSFGVTCVYTNSCAPIWPYQFYSRGQYTFALYLSGITQC